MLNLQGPIWVYDNWGLYEPTTIVNTPVTEEMSLRQVREIARLQKHGVRFDYYMMNAFWYTPGSAYREWNKEHWPNGPDRWIQACQEIGVKPGMWFAPNLLWKNRVAPAWQDSYSGDAHRPYGTPMDGSLSFFEGGFLADFMQALEHWYGRGIRLFELDMLDLQAATPASRAKLSKDEIRERNKAALMAALAAFRQKCPEAVIVGFNGFNFSLSIHPVDVDWLKVLETCYAGDLRVTNVPHSSYWRATDYFGDERTRLSEENGVPLHRIDGCSIVLSQTSFVDFRQAHAWKGMFLQAVARGGWKQTVYGAIDLIRTDEDARWLARLQKLYDPLLKGGTKSFGPRPVADKPDREPYGYVSSDSEGAVYTIINPANAVREIQLESPQGRPEGGRVLFRDAGYVPVLDKGALTLGPGQMAVVGFGRYAGQDYDLGVQQDVVIPKKIEPVTATFREVGPNTFEATIVPPAKGGLRITFQQFSTDGKPLKMLRYPVVLRYASPTDMQPLQGPIAEPGMKIQAWQPGYNLRITQDQPVTPPGISWALGEIREDDVVAGRPITIRCTSAETRPAVFKARVYAVEY
jgi:hypothetical protein